MAKKKTALTQTLFRDINPYGQEEQAAAVPSGDGLLRLSLTAVLPDPGQPRQLLPADLQAPVANGRLSTQQAMQQWLALIPQPRHLAELHKLADSIAQHGLINPITVRLPSPDEQPPVGVTHYIVTGERRYWAHVLLAQQQRSIQTGSDTVEPTQIPAILAADGITIRAHQLIENIIREDINAVEKAQGLWALRRELSGVNDSSPTAKLVPWTDVSKVLNISNRYRIYLTAVLSLTPEAQELVHQHDLAEMTIRPIVQKLKEHPELQLAALRQLITWQEENETDAGSNRAITKSVQELVDKLLQRSQRTTTTTKANDLSPKTRRFSNQLRSTVRLLNRLRTEEVALVARDLALDHQFTDSLADLETLKVQLDAILAQIATYQKEK